MWRAALHLRHAAPCATLAAVTHCDADLQRRTTWTASSDKLGPPRVHRIVITGGPCAGKTTAMAKLSDRLTNIGFAVFVVPEVATLTITGGAKPGTYSTKQHKDWETSVLRTQMALEDNFKDIAEKCSVSQGKHAVLLMDRGTMDVLAYVGKDAFDDVLEEFQWTVPQLRDQRYEAVVHLVTAAIGAEQFYSLENNKARMESRPEAIALDGRLARAWVGHNALHVVENGTGSFEEKIRRTVDVVCRSLGVPGPRAKPRWWIVRNVDEAALAKLEPAEWRLEHCFLNTSDGSESRVTKKSSEGGGPATYHHRVRGAMVGDEHSTSERTLSLREYKALLKTRDPGRLKIKKTRRAFLYEDEYYMLDTFHSPQTARGTTTLFVEAPKGEFSFPPFLEAKVDVTTKHWFSSSAHDSYARTMMMANEVSENDADASADPRRW